MPSNTSFTLGRYLMHALFFLHYGTNSLRVVIIDEGGINYFSMIVSTNACGM